MAENRHGQVVTFYSYNGGTGRTMAIANVAWILAANGKKVLVADWDLESPGLHRFFAPFIDADAFAHTGGVIDLIREFEWATTRDVARTEDWYEQYARVATYSFGLSWTFPSGGTLDFLSAGRQNNDYAASIQGLDWDAFYEGLGGGQFLDALRADMKRNYDYTLIDSRTGLSDVVEICTIQLPDILVACFTFSEQSINGAAQVARMVEQRYDARNIRILPVPMRVDMVEPARANAGRLVAMRRFAGIPIDLTDDERSAYWATMQIPYLPFYAYEEILAIFADVPGSSRTLLSAYETVVKYISAGTVTALPPMENAVRHDVTTRFTRRVNVVEEEVTLRYAAEDQVWAEWIEQLLIAAGVRVQDKWTPPGRPAEESASARQLAIISMANLAVEGSVIPYGRGEQKPPLAVYLADVRALPGFPMETSTFVHDQSAAVAAERILRLVGCPTDDLDLVAVERRARFPGQEPAVFNVPARNKTFTGREDDLRHLRAQLRAMGAAVVLPGTLPVALQGMGGIGKTQLAMEYAHRFRSAYDVIWWIAADPVTFIDPAFADLGVRLGIPAQPSDSETTRVVLRSLDRGEPYPRWLVIFDNAEDPEQADQFLPRGGGHVLITSRDPSWCERTQAIQVDLFERHESIAHLRQRVPTITNDEANQVAEHLGDLPIAVAAAAAWLDETGTPVSDYLRHIDRDGPTTLAVEANWDLSLARLREQSPAAYRLLQLCSVLAPEIALDLIYSDELAAALTPIDPSLAERSVRDLLVQQMNRLALLKLDLQRGGGSPREPVGQGASVQVHRLLQHVVRSRMTADELTAAQHQMHMVLAASRPRGEVDDPYTWRRFRLLWPHLEVSGALSCTAETVQRLLIDRVQYLWLTGGLAQGRELAERIEQVWIARLDSGIDPHARLTLLRHLLHLRYQLAQILRDQAQFDASRALDMAVLQDQRELLGPDHPHVLITAGGLAADLRALGQYAEARQLDEFTHAAWSRLFGDDHPRTLTALSHLASSYRLAGQYHAAREHDHAVYDRRRLILGAEHPYTLASASNLGRDLREVGEYDQSMDRLREVLRTFTEVLGPQSRGALTAGANLAVSLRVAGHADEAAELLETAYEGLNDAFGPASPDTLSCRLSRSVTLLALGERGQAAAELEAVRAAYEQSLGPTHPHALVCVNNLAAVASASGEHQQARALAWSASEQLSEVLGARHPYPLLARMNLAVFTAAAGELGEAVEEIKDVGADLARVLGPDHPDTLCCQANQASMLRQLGDGSPAAYVNRVIDPHPF